MYFHDIFSSLSPSNAELDKVIDVVPVRVFNEINQEFLKEFTADEACEANGRICGVAVTRSTTKVSHLLFAGDTLIFCQATKEALGCAWEVLNVYGKTSEQQVNLQKSSIVFNGNTDMAMRDELAVILGVRIDTIHEKYIGLPYVVGATQKGSILSEKPGVEESRWVEGENSITSREVNIGQVYHPINTFLRHELFQNT
ncbi:UNVERIFIED_CONTAM: hypothetical protein Scaly_1658500 [Sesamum calycinum]|uniref:Uncharacterized protein n=1 Tax=Sesamum calycinum TaxID=2727403 RepID=A0AAW2NRE2_9LAMI